MATTHDSLHDLFDDIADNIRLKTGSQATMTAHQMPAQIASIPSDPSGECTATDNDILSGKTAYAGNQLRTGTITSYNGEYISELTITPPTKTSYAVEDVTLDLTGLVVKNQDNVDITNLCTITANDMKNGELTSYSDKIIVNYRGVVKTTPINVIGKYLCFTATQANTTIGLMKYDGYPSQPDLNLETSTDKITWTAYTMKDMITLANIGDKLYWRGVNDYISKDIVDQDDTVGFKVLGQAAVSGNVNTLLDYQNVVTEITTNSALAGLFYNESGVRECYITTTPEMPAKTVSDMCMESMYRGSTIITSENIAATSMGLWTCSNMYYGCSSLIKAPELFASTATIGCYYSMFEQCSSLINPPILPATTLANYCYSGMFSGCSALIQAPALPATVLASNCYRSMFYGCTALETAPVISATTISGNETCFYMFGDCTSLTTPPALYFTTLVGEACYCMFYNCTSLQVNDSPVSGTAEQAWTIPASGTITTAGVQDFMFEDCAGTRASSHLPGEAGHSYTYYTQNTPVG